MTTRTHARYSEADLAADGSRLIAIIAALVIVALILGGL